MRNLTLAAIMLATSTSSYYAIERPFQGLRSSDIIDPDRGWVTSARSLTSTSFSALAIIALVIAVAPSVERDAPTSNYVSRFESQTNAGQDAPLPVGRMTAEQLEPLQVSWKAEVQAAALTSTVPDDLDPSLATLAERRGLQPELCASSECSFGSGSKVVYIVGNSFAQMIEPTVSQALDLSEWTVQLHWRSGCQIAYTNECSDVFDLNGTRPDLLILSDSTYADPTHPYSEVLKRFGPAAQALAAQAAATVIFSEPAPADAALVDCVDRDSEAGPACDGDVNGVADANTTKSRTADAIGATFINLSKWLCVKDTCPAVIGTHPTLVDKQHIYAQVAASLAPLFRLQLISAGILNPAATTAPSPGA